MHALAVTLLVLASARGYGGLALSLVRCPSASRAEREALSLGLGLGVVAYAVLGIGLLGWLSLAPILAVLAVGLGLNLPTLVSEGFPGATKARKLLAGWLARLSGLTLLERVLLGVLLAMAGVNLLAALAPPAGVDPLVYHLAVPQLYLLEQRIDFVPGNHYASQPFAIQMLYTVALALGSDSAAQVLHWAFGLLAMAALALLGLRFYPRPVVVAAAVLFYAISDVAVQASLALIDLGAAAFFLLAALAVFRAFEQPRLGWLVAAGLLAGLFAASRLTNPAGVVALAGLVLLVGRGHGRPWLDGLGRAALLGAIAFIVVSPWYLKSWVMAGNPVYPFLFEVFGGRDLLPAYAAELFRAQYLHVEAGYTLLDLLAVPLTLTFSPERLNSGHLGPLYLGLLPLALMVRQPTQARWLLVLALLFLPLWFWSYPRLRTLLPLLALVSLPLAAAWLDLFGQRLLALRWLAVVALAAWLVVSLAANLRYHAPAIPAGLGVESRDGYLARVLPGPLYHFPWYADFQAIADRLPADARVMIWETRGYYLPRQTIWARALAQSLTPEQQAEPEALARRARELGVTHLALPRSTLRDAELERLRQTMLRTPALQPEFETEQVTVFGLDRET